MAEYPPVLVNDIAKFNNWDRRECAVSNADAWKSLLDNYISTNKLNIPRTIHQIWIGPRDPPCVWLDTWRCTYMHKNPHYNYVLWNDKNVEELKPKMINADLYEIEKMYQCKADLLRLEILYLYGGIYIDADMVSLEGKSLEDLIVSGEKDSGFLIGYEPDTKDKPYSVLGNSFIAATKGHPLVMMLMLYTKMIYHHKRPYHGVEWVTGPLAYTKCLVHPSMRMTNFPSHYLYPKFHYVPNPDAIDLASFPQSYAFQFGYTCSGLEGWVKNNNRCRKALECFYHSRVDAWPFGGLETIPAPNQINNNPPIPKVIHQFHFRDDGPPIRWTNTWSKDFVAANPGFTYKLWNFPQLKGKTYFCANMYRDDRPMDESAVLLLALEVLYKEGGYYVPLSTMWKGTGISVFFNDPKKALQVGASIIGTVAKGNEIVDLIKDLYEGASPAKVKFTGRTDEPKVCALGYPDSLTAYIKFPSWSRFLGVEEIFDFTVGLQENLLDWAYDCNVPCFRPVGEDRQKLIEVQTRCIVITDEEFGVYKSLHDAIPTLVSQADKMDENWDILLIGLEWQTGVNEKSTYKVTMGIKPPWMKFVAVVFNQGRAKHMTPIPGTGSIPSEVLESFLHKHNDLNIFVGAQKFAETKELSSMLNGIQIIKSAFRQLASHEPPFEYDQYEIYGTRMKGFKNDRLSLELSSEGEGRLMYRSWNDDGGLNCEMKIQQGFRKNTVEWAKVYFAHQVVFEAQNTAI